MNRRGFLGSMLALAAAPAIVRAQSIMRIANPTRGMVIPLGLAGVVREIRAYDLRSDRFMLRWDIVGVNASGILQQIHVGAEESGAPENMRAMQGRPLYVFGAEAGIAHLPETRELALGALREGIMRYGITPERGILELPRGVEHAEILSI